MLQICHSVNLKYSEKVKCLSFESFLPEKFTLKTEYNLRFIDIRVKDFVQETWSEKHTS